MENITHDKPGWYIILYYLVLTLLVGSTLNAFGSGLVETPSSRNKALLVGVSHGLPGLQHDIRMISEIASQPSYDFSLKVLRDSDAKVSDVARELEDQSSQVLDMLGTFLFYFTGHGARGVIYPQDRTMKVSEIREAIEAGREKYGPLARLVLIFDSCHSGSLIDPLNTLPMNRLSSYIENYQLHESVLDEFSIERNERRANYWRKLFVFTSARADETCLAGAEGSVFTSAIYKAFNEAKAGNKTTGEFITSATSYTNHSHPQSRTEPSSLKQEILVQ